jgi:hypothetical protein
MLTKDLRQPAWRIAIIAFPLVAAWAMTAIRAGETPTAENFVNSPAASTPEPASQGAAGQNPADRFKPDPRATPTKVVRYAESLLRKYDRNADAQLSRDEWSAIRGEPARIDRNADGLVKLEELIQHIVEHGARRKIRLMSPPDQPSEDLPPLLNPSTAPRTATPATPNGEPAPADRDTPDEVPAIGNDPRRTTKFYVPAVRLPDGLPPWFLARDSDGDGQLTMAEYAPQATASQLAEFGRYDLDADGVLTAGEYLRAVKPAPAATK